MNFDSTTPAYEVGDVIAYQTFGQEIGARIVVVTAKEADIKNGRPGFDAVLIDGTGSMSFMPVWGYDDQIVKRLGKARTALIKGQADRIDAIKRYMPSNYFAEVDGDTVVIHGYDNAGWTLDGYVIPRLASGLYRAEEVTA
jgi:hypothetical protein